MSRGGRFGWFLGLIFGTLFGVLFAPRKGKELRANIKADRKRGKLGIAPLHDDLKSLGHELANLARDIYYSEAVQDIVERGRKQVKELSDDFVGEVADFHKTRIVPIQQDVKVKSKYVKEKLREGKRTIRETKHEWNDLSKKVKASARVGKKAVREIKGIMKKREK